MSPERGKSGPRDEYDEREDVRYWNSPEGLDKLTETAKRTMGKDFDEQLFHQYLEKYKGHTWLVASHLIDLERKMKHGPLQSVESTDEVLGPLRRDLIKELFWDPLGNPITKEWLDGYIKGEEK